MTPKERILSVFEGRTPDMPPVVTPYLHLADADHWGELTGLPVWKFTEWQYMEPVEHAARYKTLRELLPFDIFQPWSSKPREERERTRIIHRDGKAYIKDMRSGFEQPVPTDIHLSGSGGGPNETRHVFTKEDVRARTIPMPAEQALEEGRFDNEIQVVNDYGQDNFILGGGVANTFFCCSWHVGLTNLFSLLYDEPELIDYLSNRILEQNIEIIRAIAATKSDAIYVDDVTATSDMISRQHYERFCLPHMREQVREIHSLGKKAFVLYFGGVADRIDAILSSGADGIFVEASMKGYVNDVGELAKVVGDKSVLFGNINPYDHIERATDVELASEVRRQHEAATAHCRFITSSGSPLTPGTPVARLKQFIEMGHVLPVKRQKCK